MYLYPGGAIRFVICVPPLVSVAVDAEEGLCSITNVILRPLLGDRLSSAANRIKALHKLLVARTTSSFFILIYFLH